MGPKRRLRSMRVWWWECGHLRPCTATSSTQSDRSRLSAPPQQLGLATSPWDGHEIDRPMKGRPGGHGMPEGRTGRVSDAGRTAGTGMAELGLSSLRRDLRRADRPHPGAGAVRRAAGRGDRRIGGDPRSCWCCSAASRCRPRGSWPRPVTCVDSPLPLPSRCMPAPHRSLPRRATPSVSGSTGAATASSTPQSIAD